MIWIASYPRSGNTFVRNLLFQVYGIQSGEYHDEDRQLIYNDLQTYPFVKTHFLPGQLPKKWQSCPSIYIVRDGRDCTVSEAHYRQQLHGSEASYEFDLQRCITAKEGNHFGGWSTNAKQWLKKADVVLRFENLIKDPVTEMEKIRLIYDLPKPDISNIPSFESQRKNTALYHGDKGSSKGFEHIKNLSSKFYRRGEANAWKSEMPYALQLMYWKLHGATMEQMGYTPEGNLNEIQIDKTPAIPDTKHAIILDTNQQNDDAIDGIKRYELTLQKGLVHQLKQGSLPFEFFLNGDQVEKLAVPYAYDAIVSGQTQKKPNMVMMARNVFERFLSTVRRLLDKNYHHFQRFCQVTGLKHIYQIITGRLAKIELEAHSQHNLTHHLAPTNKPAKGTTVTTLHGSSSSTDFAETLANSNLISTSKHIKRGTEAALQKHSLLHKVIYPGVDHEEFYPVMDIDYTDILNQYSLKHKQYLLLWCSSASQAHFHNYVKATIRLLNQPVFSNYKILVVGKHEGDEEGILQHESVNYHEYLPQQHLASLYHGAALMCYISRKGFGLPLLEVMRCKTIPVHAGTHAIKEVLGEEGIATDPDNVEDIYLRMKTVLEDEQEREAMEMTCYLKSWDYTLESMTRQTLEVYKELI